MDAGGLAVGDGAVEDAKAKDGVALLAAHLRSGLPTVGGAGDGVSDGMLRRRTVPLTRRLDGAGDDVVQLRDVMWPPLGGRIDDGHVRGHPLHVVGGIGNGAAVDVVGGALLRERRLAGVGVVYAQRPQLRPVVGLPAPYEDPSSASACQPYPRMTIS